MDRPTGSGVGRVHRCRTGPAAVWTGHQMIVWGGSTNNGLTGTDFKDGAAYQPPAA